eukprot:gene10389-biopygen8071
MATLWNPRFGWRQDLVRSEEPREPAIAGGWPLRVVSRHAAVRRFLPSTQELAVAVGGFRDKSPDSDLGSRHGSFTAGVGTPPRRAQPSSRVGRGRELPGGHGRQVVQARPLEVRRVRVDLLRAEHGDGGGGPLPRRPRRPRRLRQRWGLWGLGVPPAKPASWPPGRRSLRPATAGLSDPSEYGRIPTLARARRPRQRRVPNDCERRRFWACKEPGL